MLALVISACLDTSQESFAVRNTYWTGETPIPEYFIATGPPIDIKIRFGVSQVHISYGNSTYDASYTHDARQLQGGIFIEDFKFDDGSSKDVFWLFTVAKDTRSMSLTMFPADPSISWSLFSLPGEYPKVSVVLSR